MKNSLTNEKGEVDIKSVEALSREDLRQWIFERLHGEDSIIPVGTRMEDMPSYLLATLYPKLARHSRGDMEDITLEFLKDLAYNPESEWLGEAGNELMMLVDPLLVRSPRREDAIDLLLDISNSSFFQSKLELNLHFRALQSLIMLRHRASASAWHHQYQVGGERYAPVVIEGLALVDVAAPFNWLMTVEWNKNIESAITNILPSLLEDYGTAKVASVIEQTLPSLSNGGVEALLAFCLEEDITLLQYTQSLRIQPPPVKDSKQRTPDASARWNTPTIMPPEGPILNESKAKPEIDYQRLTIVPQQSEGEGAPLSFAQQRLWFLHQLDPDRSEYNESEALSLNGNLDVSVLEKSLNEIVSRHTILRTTFVMIEGEPSQVAYPSLIVNIPFIDLADLSEAEMQRQASQLAAEMSQQPFDLERGPLLRTKLLRLAADKHVFLLTAHHIVCDGWSLGILLRELRVIYSAFLAGRPSPLPRLPLQYADFARWQRQWLQGEVLEIQRSYWMGQLKDTLSILQLPADYPRSATQELNASKQLMSLSRDITKALKALSHREGTTLFMTLLAVFNTLLFRYTGEKDILVGTPIANRRRGGIRRLIGLFVNTLVMRTKLDAHMTFRELLTQVRSTALEAYAHQEMPFELLVKELQPVRNFDQNPLFRVMLALQNVPNLESNLPGITLTHLEFDYATTKYLDLTFNLVERDQGLDLALEYNLALFEPATIKRMLGHFLNLLKGVLANPEAPISTLPLLDEQERTQVLNEWNDSETKYPKGHCIHQLFEGRAKINPESEALTCHEARFTYEELNKKANQLAHHLRSVGAGPEVNIGICLDRSAEMIIGLLGIFKSGAAYVPLDPHYPKERLAYMLDDAKAEIVLTQKSLNNALPEHSSTIINLDEDWADISKHSSEDPGVEVSADNLAYIIYTSGSTGTPKGVAVTHDNVIRLFEATEEWFHFTAEDAWTMFHSYAFDFSVWEIWGALLYGGRLVVVPNSIANPEAFYELLIDERVTVLNHTPSAFQMLMKVDERNDRRGDLALRLVILGGEALEMASLRGWFERHEEDKPRLVNMYGITETTVHVTCKSIRIEDTGQGSLIGSPMCDSQVYILDNAMEPVPIGVPGEIYVAGAGLARGYLNQAGLTAERFLPNPFSKERGARLYKTGDLAKRLNNGEIEYLGRRDHQVKVRGYRIELAEIESFIVRHEAVRQAAVLARQDEHGNNQLVAYIVVNHRPAPTTEELRGFLQHKLPEYMIPKAFVLLESLPLTANGKLDRHALPELDQSRLERGNAFVAPRTPVEEIVCSIWSQVLGINEISIEDNFFHLGGDSLLATQMVSRIREVFQVDLPLRTIFETPTVASLSKAIAVELEAVPDESTILLAPVARGERIPLSFAQQRLWFLHQLQPDNVAYNIPCALRFSGRLDTLTLQRSLNEIALRHETLRTAFVSEGGLPFQVISAMSAVELPIIDLRHLSPDQREITIQQIANEEQSRPFDLSSKPLFRITLLQLDEQDHILLFTTHHIISDGWSIGIFIQELASLYEAFAEGRPSPLPDLPIQYADYACWQRDWLKQEVIEKQLAYWREQLGGIDAVLRLPADHPRPPGQTFQGASQSFVIPLDLLSALKGLCRSKGVTLFMGLLAAFQALLYRYTNQTDIVVGTPIAGRNRVEIEGLIGFFVNTLVLRGDLRGDPNFLELIERTRETSLGAYAHHDLPFEKLVEELQPERSLSHTPLFQVMFVLQNISRSAIELRGLRLIPLEVEHQTAKFDLTLSLTETEQGLAGSFEYNTDLFEADSINRMIGHFQSLLEGTIKNPSQRLSELPLLTQAESTRLLVEWNNTDVHYQDNSYIHQLFEAQAKRTPEAEAVTSVNERLTYSELNRRANQLAWHLQALGAGPETVVAICQRRSPQMIVSLLGVLKSGAAYVPVVPDYPSNRTEFILRDSRAKLILTEEALLESLPTANSLPICIDRDWQNIAAHSEDQTVSGVNDDNLAYITYTSGSTGEPKGVMVTHRGLTNYLNWAAKYYQLGEGETVPLHTSIGFDLTVTSLYVPIMVGAKIELIEEGEETQELSKEISRGKQYGLIKMTPSHLDILSESIEKDVDEVRVRVIVIGGEALMSERVKYWKKKASSTRIINEYGPTETVVGSVAYEVRLEEKEEIVAIGRPIANTRVYILNEKMEIVPIGVNGELYIGGEGVGRGYVGRPGQTAERYVPDRYSETGGERLYRTGDICRYRADGEIEYLGRVDSQVKIRGYRIELGEIEELLSQHPAIANQALAVIEANRLVAYIVKTEMAEVTSDELRNYLRKRVPDYMLPSMFVELERMPLTPNGKLDRKALPGMKSISQDVDKQYIGPRTAIEESLANIWKEVLGVDRVGVHDNFFDLGGHSLLVIQVIARSMEVGVHFTISQFFSHPTIAELAELTSQSDLDNEQLAERIADDLRQLFCEPEMAKLFELVSKQFENRLR